MPKSGDSSSKDWIDGTLYPDTEPPESIETLQEQVDFLSRLCGAWDFGILPVPTTIAEIRHPRWRQAVDECRLLTSPSYHLLRSWHGLPRLRYLGRRMPHIAGDPNLQYI